MTVIIDHPIQIKKISTKSIEGQKPGTSGLRKKVTVFQELHYTQNFIQAYFNALRKDALSPKNTLLVGGDGRYFSEEVIGIICRIACAQGINQLHIAQGSLMSTPACSAYIRHLNETVGNCIGGILLTASHNPGGPTQDFGIKFNSRNGGPAQEQFTNLVHQETLNITEFSQADIEFLKYIDLSKQGEYHFTQVHRPFKPVFVIKVIESIQIYVDLMKKLFDFPVINKLLHREDFKMVFDGMFGASGPYAKAIFGKQLGNKVTLHNCDPKPDFNGHHPDPNLECAKDLVNDMGYKTHQSQFDFGAACDGDADRNMIFGKCFFVTPSDSLAVLASQSHYFLKNKLKGVARSMPTSGAVDRVTKNLGINLYETPTGWKFFGNLMQQDLIGLCGEESFGTGSPHIREKDGLWTILAWLQILAKNNESKPIGHLLGVESILHKFWTEYGRNYYSRYDFQNCDSLKGQEVWNHLVSQVSKYTTGEVTGSVFEYKDPVDKSISKNQGLIFKYSDGSRVIFRQSGTGSVGMTIRIYFQKYQPKNVLQDREKVLQGLIKFGLQLSQICELTGKLKPDVIT